MYTVEMVLFLKALFFIALSHSSMSFLLGHPLSQDAESILDGLVLMTQSLNVSGTASFGRSNPPKLLLKCAKSYLSKTIIKSCQSSTSITKPSILLTPVSQCFVNSIANSTSTVGFAKIVSDVIESVTKTDQIAAQAKESFKNCLNQTDILAPPEFMADYPRQSVSGTNFNILNTIVSKWTDPSRKDCDLLKKADDFHAPGYISKSAVFKNRICDI